MKKQYKLDEIDCANCARELQDELAKLEGVKSVSVNFMTQKLTLEADDAEFDEVLNRVVEFTSHGYRRPQKEKEEAQEKRITRA